jgi:hypothetical protein
MPVEYYYEDMHFNATISPYHANLTLDTGVSYALYAIDYGDEWAVWAFEAVLGDILASSTAHNVSDFDLYVDPDTGVYWTDPYESYGPGTKEYGEADLTWTYTATGWDLKEGEQLILKFPSGDPIPAYLHEGDLHYGSPFCENVTEMWGSSLDDVYIEPYNFLEFYNTTWENITEIAVDNWYTAWIYEPWSYWPPVNCSWVYLEDPYVYFHIDNVTDPWTDDVDWYVDFHIDELYDYATDDWLDNVTLPAPGVEYIEGWEYITTTSSGPGSVSYDPVEGILNLTGPLDLSGERWWWLPKDWRELPKDEWWGFLEYGCPYIELYYALTSRLVINSVTPSQTSATAGDSVSIDAVVTNEGYENETFKVTAYYNNTVIETKTVTSLPAGNSTTLTFTWDTTNVAASNYTVKVKAEFSSYTQESMVTVTSQPPLIPIEIILVIAGIVIIIIVAIGYVLMRKKETP